MPRITFSLFLAFVLSACTPNQVVRQPTEKPLCNYKAAAQFLRWDKIKKKNKYVELPGLKKRREAEAKLFLQGCPKNEI